MNPAPTKSTTSSRLSLLNPANFSRRQAVLVALLFAAFGALIIFRSLAATSPIATVEAETMTLPAGASVISDSTASGSKYVTFTTSGTASTPALSLPSQAISLTVRAKASQCGGAPTMIIKVDGTQIQSSSVTSASWADYPQANLTLAAGSHTLSVDAKTLPTQYKGNSGKVVCQSDLSIDKLTFYGQDAAPTPPPTATPPTAAIKVPAEGAAVTGAIPVEATATATSPSTVAKVEFYLDASTTPARTEAAAPYCLAGDGAGACYNWDSKTVADGAHSITVYSYDSAGLKSAPAKVNFTVSNPTSPPLAITKYILIDQAQLMSLSTTTSAWTNMKSVADGAISRASTELNVSAPSSGSPWLPNYGGRGSETLAAALVYARTGDIKYRDYVVRVNKYIIGSEDSPSTNGTTADVDKLLATMRQISGYVLAADLVGMDPATTGSRSGYTSTAWNSWLGTLRTKTIGTSGNKTSIVVTNNNATNWGAWASASRITIDAYLKDTADMDLAIGRLKLYLGETQTGTTWNKSLDYNDVWACHPAGATAVFFPVNPASCDLDRDGVIVEDASRSAYDSGVRIWDDKGIDYSFHALGAQLNAAIVLDRSGHSDVWNWGNQGLKRAMDRLNRGGPVVHNRFGGTTQTTDASWATGNNRTTATHVSWIPRHFYHASYPTLAAQDSESISWTDWLYPQ